MHGRIGRQFGAELPPSLFYTVDDLGQILYQPPTLLISALLFGLCLWLITKNGEPADSTATPAAAPELYLGTSPLSLS